MIIVPIVHSVHSVHLVHNVHFTIIFREHPGIKPLFMSLSVFFEELLIIRGF